MQRFSKNALVPARLVLKSGEVFHGFSPRSAPKLTLGEVVFTTGMAGYVETLTDPSFAGQILTFTFPLIGNYGVPSPELFESSKIHARAVVMSEISPFYSHFQAVQTLAGWLEEQGVPFLTGVDTRALTKRLRTSGTALGAVTTERLPRRFEDPNKSDLVGSVCVPEVKEYGQGKKRIIAVDCGMKENILRCLQNFPLTIRRVPYTHDYSEEEFDGVFLSNGPGDPRQCHKTIAILRKCLERGKPVFGICLGAQLLALSAGAKTYKLPFGHRGQNQPCQCIETKRCYLTSQNHGYAIDAESLPKEWKVTFCNLNDGSVEGIAHRELPFFAVQFHPEAAPGPVDTLYLFEQFYQML